MFVSRDEQVWVYRAGFCRFSHARYSNATEDLEDMEKHLTNIAIQVNQLPPYTMMEERLSDRILESELNFSLFRSSSVDLVLLVSLPFPACSLTYGVKFTRESRPSRESCLGVVSTNKHIGISGVVADIQRFGLCVPGT